MLVTANFENECCKSDVIESLAVSKDRFLKWTTKKQFWFSDGQWLQSYDKFLKTNEGNFQLRQHSKFRMWIKHN